MAPTRRAWRFKQRARPDETVDIRAVLAWRFVGVKGATVASAGKGGRQDCFFDRVSHPFSRNGWVIDWQIWYGQLNEAGIRCERSFIND